MRGVGSQVIQRDWRVFGEKAVADKHEMHGQVQKQTCFVYVCVFNTRRKKCLATISRASYYSSGVPQRSVLGHILFFVVIDDVATIHLALNSSPMTSDCMNQRISIGILIVW